MHHFVGVKSGLLGRGLKAARNTLLEPRHQDGVTKLFPILLGFMNRHDSPTARRRTGKVVDLPLGQNILAWVQGANGCLILLFRSTWEEVNESLGHGQFLSNKTSPPGLAAGCGIECGCELDRPRQSNLL